MSSATSPAGRPWLQHRSQTQSSKHRNTNTQQSSGMFLLSWLFIFAAGKFASPSPYIPPEWTTCCEENVSNTSLPDSNTSVRLDLRCFIPQSPRFQWKLNDLRDWTIDNLINNQTTPNSRKVIYNITVTCYNMANISLPWPMRVAGLQEIHVSNCYLLDRYKNIHDTIDATIADDLRTLEIRHCTWILYQTNYLLMDAAGDLNLTSRFDCGQESSIETIIASNVSDVIMSNRDNTNDFVVGTANQEPISKTSNVSSNTSHLCCQNGSIKPDDRIGKDTKTVVPDQPQLDRKSSKDNKVESGSIPESSEAKIRRTQKENLKFLDTILKARTKCNYLKLRFLDESLAHITSTQHFDFMVQGAVHPELEFMNYSYIGLKDLPKPLAEWRIYFPKLILLDLSHNYISEIKVPAFPSDAGAVKFILRNNNVTFISMDILRSWADVENFFVDIKDNPIHCGCSLSPLLPYLETNISFQGTLAPYEYVRHLDCHTPKELSGKKLHTLTQNSLLCPVYSSSKTSIIVLGIVMAVIIVAVVFMIKFKVEIRILLYTRLHIRLPCDADVQRNNKMFDAFVSYSNDDTGWVCENIIKFLEKSPTNNNIYVDERVNNNNIKVENSSNSDNIRTTFKLCVHQRDFIPGKTIFDNIVDSIEASRHTIIVLSPSFMRSHWAMEELRQAYRQSLIEKTRHLIVILLEKVSNDEMDPLISRCCKTFTYLEADDSLFKDRLIFSLTTKDKSAKRRDRLAAKEKKDPETGSKQEYPQMDFSLEEAHAYDNAGYSPYSGRPVNPVRELSNMSTSSTCALAPSP